jgi:hypothetical protein
MMSLVSDERERERRESGDVSGRPKRVQRGAEKERRKYKLGEQKL